jgi:hypothetical protein
LLAHCMQINAMTARRKSFIGLNENGSYLFFGNGQTGT